MALHILSPRVDDPLLYVISTALCSIRRLYYHHPVLANKMWNTVMTSTTTYGPCGALLYLHRVGWIPKEDGIVVMPSGHQVLLQVQSTREIRMQLRLAWSTYVHQISHRKGITPLPIDAYIQHKIHMHISDQTLRLIALDVTGGYQTGAVKAIWDGSQSHFCEFCGQADTHAHRQLHCPVFGHVRDNHKEAVTLLETHPNLLYFPLATIHPQQIVYNRLKWCRVGPFLDVPDIQPTSHYVFFTDGTCDRPRYQNCCRSAWAVVQKVFHDPHDPSINHFRVTQTSHARGLQSINRSELESVGWLVNHFHHHLPEELLSIYTDSSFVQKIVEAIATNTLTPRLFQLAHADLVALLQKTWGTRHSIRFSRSNRTDH